MLGLNGFKCTWVWLFYLFFAFFAPKHYFIILLGRNTIYTESFIFIFSQSWYNISILFHFISMVKLNNIYSASLVCWQKILHYFLKLSFVGLSWGQSWFDCQFLSIGVYTFLINLRRNVSFEWAFFKKFCGNRFRTTFT